MKKLLTVSTFLAFSPGIMADPIYLYDQNAGSIYITGGGGVTGMRNDDWQLHTRDQTAGTLHQPESKSNTVGTVIGAMGYAFDPLPVRVELAYRWFGQAEYKWDELYTEAPLQTAKGKINSQAAMFNAYLDWRNSSKFTPYVGGGIGYYFNRSEFERINTVNNNLSTDGFTTHHNQGLAWSVSAGFMYNIGPNWYVDMRAEYLSLGHVDFYETNSAASVSPGEQELMKTDRFAAMSGLINLTYMFSLDQL